MKFLFIIDFFYLIFHDRQNGMKLIIFVTENCIRNKIKKNSIMYVNDSTCSTILLLELIVLPSTVQTGLSNFRTTWRYRRWIFSRSPDFLTENLFRVIYPVTKAERRYIKRWRGERGRKCREQRTCKTLRTIYHDFLIGNRIIIYNQFFETSPITSNFV